MNRSPAAAARAVRAVIREVGDSHEATHLVTSQAIRICLDSGMTRRATAKFLDLPLRRISRSGAGYVRTLRETYALFRSARSSRDYAGHSQALTAIVTRAWGTSA